MSREKTKTITLAGVCAVLGLLGGATATWARTVVVLDTHIATAKIRVRTMCQVAAYQLDATERVCEAHGIHCPRPVELKPEVLGRTCEEP